ncbi:MAG TPA: GAF domain-containing protein [Trebonia sp.]|jgi:sugar diacid utilization regulator
MESNDGQGVLGKVREMPQGAKTLAAFRRLAAALAEERDLDTIFRLAVDTLSELTGAGRCSLHLRDLDTGLFHGKAAHAARDITAPVKQLISGVPGDNFTRAILETRRPVMLSNTLIDPRPLQSAMRRWRVRSVLGVPMMLRGETIGILCLDSEDTPMEFSESDQELALTFAELAATAINQVQLTAQLRGSLAAQARQLDMLQRARRMEGQLADIALRGSGVHELGEAVSRLLGKPCAIYDEEFRCLARSGGPEGLRRTLGELREFRHHPLVEPVIGSLRPGHPQYIQALPQLGIGHQLLVSAIDLSGERQGYLVVAEAAGRFGQLDEVIVRRAAHNIALDRSRSVLDQDMEWQAIEALVGSLIRGECHDIEARTRSLGVEITGRRVVCLVTARDGGTMTRISPRQVAHLLTDQESPSAALAAWSASDIALILEVPQHLDDAGAIGWVRTRVSAVLKTLSPDERLCAAISTLIDAPRDDHRAHREAQQVLKCMREHLSEAGPSMLAADDIGAARLLLASASREEARQFARDTFGSLLDEHTVKSEELLATLEAFLRRGRNVRECADELGVHPNTVRYRLAGVERLTGLSVTTDDNDYLTAQIAMTVVRLSAKVTLMSGTPDIT